MKKEELEKIIENQPTEVKAKAMLLYNGVVGGMKKYQAEASSLNLRSWQAAEAALGEFVADLGAETPRETLANVNDILARAKMLGFRLKRATAYKHQKEGRFRADSEGRYPVDKIDKYLATLRRIGGGQDEKAERQQASRAQATADKEAAQARYWQIRTKIMEGEYVEKNAFERALAQRAAVFKNDIESFVRAQAPTIINVTGGNADRAPDLIEFMLGEAANWLNRYAAVQEFAVPAPTPAALLAKDEALHAPGEEKTEAEDEEADEP